MRDGSGSQKGDPARAAHAMIAITRQASPPRHLVLGAWGYDAVLERLEARVQEIRSLHEISLAADVPAA